MASTDAADKCATRVGRRAAQPVLEYASTEQALRRTKDRFRMFFQRANDPIFVIDPEHDRILEVNSAACTMLGYSRVELLSLPVSAIHPKEMPVLFMLARTIFERGSGWTEEVSCRTKSGETVPAEMSASVIATRGGPCILALVRAITERKREERLAAQRVDVPEELKSEYGAEEIVGQSFALRRVLQQVDLVAPTDATVLITGESGTGKELIARAIHQRSARRERSLVLANCGAIPRELWESEFFGHVKGAFTGALQDRAGRFELADGGTLFLDEVAEIPRELQSKLLRVLQAGEFERVGEARTRRVDVRVIAATNRDLKRDMERKRFRRDLFFRLNVFPIELVPLRERPEDIPLLVDHLVHVTSAKLNRRDIRLTRADIDRLQAYGWPGNIRELQNVVERAVIVSRDGRLRFELPRPGRETIPRRASADHDTDEGSTHILTEAERQRRDHDNIIAALKEANGKISGPDGAAELLGVNPTTLASRINALGIEKPRRRSD